MVRRKRKRSQPTEDSTIESPAEAYQRFRADQALLNSQFGQFSQSLDFQPDDFQIKACQDLEQGNSVLVAAPTGAGKTLVGEFAIYLSQNRKGRSFYTTPIKALSNQKYHDLCDTWGEDQVGLLTGDNSINPDAPIIVMTTEVLRNMIYADSTRLDGLTHVIMDEVHYLADRFRGPVWEEVIIHLPEHVDLVCLSATVSNAEEFGDWLKEVRGHCAVTVSEERPVPLHQHMIVSGGLYDLYKPTRKQRQDINPQLAAHVERYHHQGYGRRDNGFRTRRSRVVELLRSHHFLPAIIFVFSRAGCDAMVEQLVGDGLVLTDTDEQYTIRDMCEEALHVIPSADWGVLRIHQWINALECGIASHHAGLLPVQKELVEKLFKAGLVKVVCATETLALGINMPARSVVLESLRKFNGSEHVRLTPGQYTQLTGRAGRRGIDSVGHAIVVYNRGNEPAVVASLASKRSYPLHSAFKPTYNMVTNLLDGLTMEQARHVLERSFAQYQADAKVVTLARKADKAQKKSKELAARLQCECGDVEEYLSLVVAYEKEEDASYSQAVESYKRHVYHVFSRLKDGNVIAYYRGRRLRYGLVVEPPSSRYPRQIIVVNEDARVRTIHSDDLVDGISVVGRIPLRDRYYRKPRDRARLSSELRHAVRDGELAEPTFDTPVDQGQQRLLDLKKKMEAHPCHHCDNRKKHLYDSKAWRRNEKKLQDLLSRIDNSTSTLGKQFDVICQVLESYDCIDNDQVTDFGQRLRRIYSERDLLIALCVSRGLWDACGPAELAAALAAVVCDEDDSTLGEAFTPELQDVLDSIASLWQDLTQRETRFGAETTPAPNNNYPGALWLWIKGADLEDVLDSAQVSAGDFVRAANQITDMIVQLKHAVDPSSQLYRTLGEAHRLLDKGVVAWSHM